jgi:hypothetical protein
MLILCFLASTSRRHLISTGGYEVNSAHHAAGSVDLHQCSRQKNRFGEFKAFKSQPHCFRRINGVSLGRAPSSPI